MLDRRCDTDKELTGREVLAVGTRIPPHVDQVRADLADQLFLLFTLGNCQRPLKDVVCSTCQSERGSTPSKRKRPLTAEGIFHEAHDRTETVLLGSHDLVDELATTIRVGSDQRLLAHIRRELVTSHVQHLSS